MVEIFQTCLSVGTL